MTQTGYGDIWEPVRASNPDLRRMSVFGAAEVEFSRRVRVYQSTVREFVRSTSPTVLRIASHECLDLREGVSGMLPPPTFPAGLAGIAPYRPRSQLLLAHTTFPRPKVRRTDGSFRRHFRYGGIVVRVPTDERGRFGVRISNFALEACWESGPVRLVAGSGVVVMRIEHALPETIIATLVGRPVGDLVGLPVVDGSLPILRVRSSPDGSGALVVHVRDGRVAIDLSEGR